MKHSILSVAAAAALAIGLGACHDDCQIKNDGNASGTLSFAKPAAAPRSTSPTSSSPSPTPKAP